MNLQPIFGEAPKYLIDIESGQVFNSNVSKYSNRKDNLLELKQSKTYNGYLTVCLNNQRKKVHRLVLQTFSNSISSLQVNHKDGDKTNNNYNNLEWCTSKENTIHAVLMGLKGGKQQCVRKDRKYSDAIILKVKEMLIDGYSNTEIRISTTIDSKTLYAIKHNRNYAYIKIIPS